MTALTPVERRVLEIVAAHPRLPSAALARILWPESIAPRRRSARPMLGLQRNAGKIQSRLASRRLLVFPGWLGLERGPTYLITPAGRAALEAD